ncbi:MAG: AbrB/MazE/SpoVT family DNA-binding domain-containing protein [Solirubrobacteraceae bacterium]
MSVARIYKKGQITIPKAVREAAGIEVGDRVVVEAREHEIVVRRPHGVLEFTPPASRRPDQLPWPDARRRAREERIARRTPDDE